MGQLILNKQLENCKRCNLRALRESNGSLYNVPISDGEHILVDTGNNKSGSATQGFGEYDAYVVGDGTTVGHLLTLHYFNPKSLSELSQDSTHRLVTDAEKTLWNAGGGGGGTANVDNEDLALVEQDGINVIKFKNKEYSAQDFSGYGKKNLRKNLITEKERITTDITPAVTARDEVIIVPGAPDVIRSKYVNLNNGVGEIATIPNRGNVSYLRKEVHTGDSFVFSASTKGAIYSWYWGVIDKETNEIYQRGGELPDEDVTTHLGQCTVELPENVESAYLVINIITYDNYPYWIKEAETLQTTKEFNVINSALDTIEPNTIFVVSYDYNLNGRILELPENSILKFEGGSIQNGFIIGHNSRIEANARDNIFGRNIEIIGDWQTTRWYARWFGVYADGERDDTEVLQKMLNLSDTLNSTNIILDWYDCTFRTTRGLYIKNYTSIQGGTIRAKFDDNPLDWVLQTYTIYQGLKIRYNGALAYDTGKATYGGPIKDLRIQGELNDNGDGTWSPIFGGLRLLSTGMETKNVYITNVGYGICRANTVVARDVNIFSHGYFCAYLSWYVINLHVDTAYFQAYCHHTVKGPDDNAKHIPFRQEYRPVDAYGKSFGAYSDEFIDGSLGRIFLANNAPLPSGTEKFLPRMRIKITGNLHKRTVSGNVIYEIVNPTTVILDENYSSDSDITCDEAVELANALANNATSEETYSITGYISQIESDVADDQQSFWLCDVKDFGSDDTNPKYRRPRLTALKANNTTAVFNNVAMDYWQEVAFALGDWTEITFNMVRFESVGECYLYLGGQATNVTLDTVVSSLSEPEYDIYQRHNLASATVNLISAHELSCKNTGNPNATTHKLGYSPAQNLAINVIGGKSSDYPDIDKFHFLSSVEEPSKSIRPEGYTEGWSSNNGQWLLPEDCYKTKRTLSVKANTTILFDGTRLHGQFDQPISIIGENRNTSIIKIGDKLQLGNGNHNPVSIEFRNLTIDCSGGYINTNIVQTVYGDGGNLKFIDCTIINNGGFIQGDASYGIMYNIKFYRCFIYSKTENVFTIGNILLDNQDYNRTSASPIARFGSTSDANVKDVYLNFITKGTTSNRNAITYHLGKGFRFYNLTTGKDEVWNGRQWVLDDGYPYTIPSGITANTPALPLMKIGTEYHDTTEDKVMGLVTNGTCGYGKFVFNAQFPKVSRTFYIGTTEVTVTDGEFSTNLPVGTYPVSCPGYECYPSSITVTGNSSVAIYQKASIYTSTYKVTIYAVDGNGDTLADATIIVGGVTATKPSGKDYYEVSLRNGDYKIMAVGYDDQTDVKVNGLATTITAVFETESSLETVTLDGYLYDKDHICDSNGTNIAAGTYAVAVDSTTLNVSITASDITNILYFLDQTIDDVNKQLAYLLIKKWFEAGYYGEYNNGAVLYSDTVGSTTGATATFTDTSTHLECTVTHSAGTNAVWEEVVSGGGETIISYDSMNIVAASGTTLTAAMNKYYTFASVVNTLAVILPSTTDVTTVKGIILYLTTGSTPNITYSSADSPAKPIYKFDNYLINDNTTYEINCVYNGVAWVIGSAEVASA